MNKPLAPAQAENLAALVEYQNDTIVSRRLIQKPTGNVTLFAFDKGEELSEHTVPFDALIQVLEGEAQIFIEDKWHDVKCAEIIILPANKPHAVKAPQRFKMLLTMIRS